MPNYLESAIDADNIIIHQTVFGILGLESKYATLYGLIMPEISSQGHFYGLSVSLNLIFSIIYLKNTRGVKYEVILGLNK